MSKYWEEEVELNDPEEYQDWLAEYKEDEFIERELDRREAERKLRETLKTSEEE